MTERHSDPAAGNRRMTTGEFRATPDISASTAEFRAFAENRSETTQQWGAVAPRRNPARTTLLIVVAVVILAAIAILVATLG